MSWRGWAIGGTIIGLFVAYQALSIAWLSGVFQRVPSTRDPRLVGRWTGRSEYLRSGPIDFRADGTAAPFRMPQARAFWGSSDGILYVKQRSAEAGWDLARAPYRIGAGGDTVQTQPGHWFFMIPEKMTRRP